MIEQEFPTYKMELKLNQEVELNGDSFTNTKFLGDAQYVPGDFDSINAGVDNLISKIREHQESDQITIREITLTLRRPNKTIIDQIGFTSRDGILQLGSFINKFTII